MAFRAARSMSMPAKLAQLSRATLSSTGKGPILQSGSMFDSPWPVPECVEQKLVETTDQTHHILPHGVPELRQSAASLYSKELDLDFTARNILVSTGTMNTLFHLQSAYDADVLVPSPSSESYTAHSQLLGQRMQWIHTAKENGYRLTAEQLHQEAMRTPDRPHILLLSSPNVAGSTYSRDELEEMASICRRFQILCVSDESAAPLLFGGEHEDGAAEHHSMASCYPEGTVVVVDTKWCGGYNLELLLFPDSLEWIQSAMAFFGSGNVASSIPFQHALCAALDNYDGGEIQQYLDVQRTIHSALAFKGFTAFQEIEGCAVQRPRGGVHIFPDFTEVFEDSVLSPISDNGSLSEMMRRECNMTGLEGDRFGRVPDELTMGFAMTDFEGERIFENMDKIPEDVESEEMDAFITKHCARTVQGLEAVRDLLSDPALIEEERTSDS